MRITKICKTKQELDEYNEPGVAAWLNPETECWEHVVIEGPPIIVCSNKRGEEHLPLDNHIKFNID